MSWVLVGRDHRKTLDEARERNISVVLIEKKEEKKKRIVTGVCNM